VLVPVAVCQADIDREIKFPVFKAAADPDIRFFGFDRNSPTTAVVDEG
jgi:hypothetical protein